MINHLEQPRIFVADGDRSCTALMQDLLQGEGYLVNVLEPALNAYEEIVRTQPDLVILDTMLERPGARWLTLDKLKHNPGTTSIPVIVCTTDVSGLRAKKEELAATGCIALEKPFDIDVLLSGIQECLW